MWIWDVKVGDGEWQEMEPRSTAETCKAWAKGYVRVYFGNEPLHFRIFDPLGRCIYAAHSNSGVGRLRWLRGDYLTRDGERV